MSSLTIDCIILILSFTDITTIGRMMRASKEIYRNLGRSCVFYMLMVKNRLADTAIKNDCSTWQELSLLLPIERRFILTTRVKEHDKTFIVPDDRISYDKIM